MTQPRDIEHLHQALKEYAEWLWNDSAYLVRGRSTCRMLRSIFYQTWNDLRQPTAVHVLAEALRFRSAVRRLMRYDFGAQHFTTLCKELKDEIDMIITELQLLTGEDVE